MLIFKTKLSCAQASWRRHTGHVWQTNICLQFRNRFLNSSFLCFFYLSCLSYSVLLYITNSNPNVKWKSQSVNSLVSITQTVICFQMFSVILCFPISAPWNWRKIGLEETSKDLLIHLSAPRQDQLYLRHSWQMFVSFAFKILQWWLFHHFSNHYINSLS